MSSTKTGCQVTSLRPHNPSADTEDGSADGKSGLAVDRSPCGALAMRIRGCVSSQTSDCCFLGLSFHSQALQDWVCRLQLLEAVDKCSSDSSSLS
jgi:hypothetical protein